ncbi:hypothetical protein LIER_10421 [Lithospermum erythrorhizon]|uniref:Uncharacterized protein n=1 Tax=Lithospermum erythrorhizon TaxID=34254 RepID=A0AAV3PNI6_LITER
MNGNEVDSMMICNLGQLEIAGTFADPNSRVRAIKFGEFKFGVIGVKGGRIWWGKWVIGGRREAKETISRGTRWGNISGLEWVGLGEEVPRDVGAWEIWLANS